MILLPILRRCAFAGLAAAIVAAARPAAAADAAVIIDNFSFRPQTLTVLPGTTVTWTNHDDIPHTVVEKNAKFRSKALDTNDTTSITFMTPGTYTYFCSLHPHMTGSVVVEASTGK